MKHAELERLFTLIGCGRIEEILSAIKRIHNVEDVADLNAETKLSVLCNCLQLDPEALDNLIATNSAVLRTVKGHSFEVALEVLLKKQGCEVEDIGGDTCVDLVVNSHTLQLKTPNVGGTSQSAIEYKTHKTHGAKSQVESMSYYHRIESFADFFVGLISYCPLEIFIIPKADLPRHELDSSYIASPFKISKAGCPFLNNYSALGIDANRLNSQIILPRPNELLPLTSKRIGLTSDIILNTILRASNFRIWDMSIRGFAREAALRILLKKCNREIFDPVKIKKERGDKSDLALMRKDGTYAYIQVKGASIKKCSIEGANPKIATETQLTRGRVNDHPTQSRLYLKTDFDYLLLSLDPALSYKLNKGIKWSFYLIPTHKLKEHERFNNRLHSLQKFHMSDLSRYELSAMNIKELFIEQPCSW